MASPLTRLNPPTLPDVSAIGYSQITVAEAGRLAFVSGQVAARPGGGPVPAGHGAQAAVVAENARAALDALGATPEDVVMVRAFMVDMTPERVGEAMAALRALFGDRPSLTGVGVAALAAPDLLVEVEMVVRLPD